MNYGKSETWKIVYCPPILDGGMRGVALIEACTRHDAVYTFQKQYEGQYSTIESVTQIG